MIQGSQKIWLMYFIHEGKNRNDTVRENDKVN